VCADKDITTVSTDQNAERSEVGTKKLHSRRVTFDDPQEQNDFVRIKVIEKKQTAIIVNQNFGDLK
jgi:hypothetical protein